MKLLLLLKASIKSSMKDGLDSLMVSLKTQMKRTEGISVADSAQTLMMKTIQHPNSMKRWRKS